MTQSVRLRAAAWLALVLAAGAGWSVLGDLPSPWRPLATLAFAFIAPGLVVVVALRLPSLTAEVALVVPVSLSIVAAIAGVVLYAGAWSSDLILGILIIGTVSAAAAHIFLSYRSRSTPPQSMSGAESQR